MAEIERVEDDGTWYELPKSKKPSESNGGYEGVVKPGRLFHAKTTLARGGGQTMLPGAGFATAREAALELAKFKAKPFEIEKNNPARAKKGEGNGKVRAPQLPPAHSTDV